MDVAQKFAGPLMVVNGAEDIATVVLGKWAVIPISLLNNTDLLMTVAILLVLQAQQLANITMDGGIIHRFGKDVPSFLPGGTKAQATTFWSLYLTPPLIILSWLRSPKALSKVAEGGFVALCVVTVAIIWGCVKILGDSDRVAIETHIAPDMGNVAGAGLIFSFSFAVSILAPGIYRDMADKSQFDGAANLAHVIILVIYAIVAILGYIVFGDATGDELTSNAGMQAQPTLLLVIAILLTLSKFVTMPLFLHPVTESCVSLADGWCLPGWLDKMLWAVVATVLMIGCAAVAILVPMFYFLQGIIAAVTTMSMCVFFPNVILLASHQKGWKTLPSPKVIISVVFIFLGIGISVFGLRDACGELSNELAKDNPTSIQILFG